MSDELDERTLLAFAKLRRDRLTAMRSPASSGARAEGRGAPRYVVTGAPNSGKTTWCQQQARPGDLVWDLDALASALTLGGLDRPRGTDGRRGLLWPWPIAKALLTMRDALVQWLSTVDLPTTQVFLIVCDPSEAQRIAARIHADVVEWSRDKWESR